MFKKLLIASAVLASCSSVAFAGHAYKGEKAYKDYKDEMPCPKYQFAAGPYIGLSAGVRNNYTGTPTVYKGLEGILSLGYGVMLNPSWYLAGEIFGGDSAQLKDYNEENNSNNGVKTTWNFGASIIPGYMITDYVLTYLRAGVVRARFSDMSTNKTGWQIGLGGQTNIYQNWDLRGEYVYSQYQSISGIGKPASDQVNLGIVYKFV